MDDVDPIDPIESERHSAITTSLPTGLSGTGGAVAISGITLEQGDANCYIKLQLTVGGIPVDLRDSSGSGMVQVWYHFVGGSKKIRAIATVLQVGDGTADGSVGWIEYVYSQADLAIPAQGESNFRTIDSNGSRFSYPDGYNIPTTIVAELEADP